MGKDEGVFDQYTQYVAREARGKWVRRIRVIALALFGVAMACELFCALVLYQYGGEKADYSYAFWQLRYESESGPWNGGHPWERERVNGYKKQLAIEYQQELWEGTTAILIALPVTLLVAVGCTLLLIVERRRLPHFNELM